MKYVIIADKNIRRYIFAKSFKQEYHSADSVMAYCKDIYAIKNGILSKVIYTMLTLEI